MSFKSKYKISLAQVLLGGLALATTTYARTPEPHMSRSIIFKLGGFLALLFISCCTATPTQNTNISSSSSISVLRDTLPGLIDTRLVVRNSVEPESTSILLIKNFANNLVVSTAYGEFYVQINGQWQNLKLPNGDVGATDHAIAVKNDNTIYLLGRLSLWEWNISGEFKEISIPKKEDWCMFKYEAQCKIRSVFSFENKLILVTSMGYVDSLGVENGIVATSENQGMTWQKMTSFPKTTPRNESIRNLTYDGKNVWIATWERGIWYYNGTKWDSIPYYQFSDSTKNLSYPIVKYGGVAVLNGQVYATDLMGYVNLVSGFSQVHRIAPTQDYIRSSSNGFRSGPRASSFGLDTACGALINNNSWEYWKPGMPDWARIIDTKDQEFAFAHTEYRPINIAQTLASVRVGDTLFISYTGGGTDVHNGGVMAFDLRQARWCTDAWDRGKAWRDSIGAAQKARNGLK